MNNEVQSSDAARYLLESIVLWVESTTLEHRIPATVKHVWRFLDCTEPAQPVEAVDENLIAAWATSVGAEVDGGDAPNDRSNYPGYGATITFDLAQLAAFVRLAYSTRSDP